MAVSRQFESWRACNGRALQYNFHNHFLIMAHLLCSRFLFFYKSCEIFVSINVCSHFRLFYEDGKKKWHQWATHCKGAVGGVLECWLALPAWVPFPRWGAAAPKHALCLLHLMSSFYKCVSSLHWAGLKEEQGREETRDPGWGWPRITSILPAAQLFVHFQARVWPLLSGCAPSACWLSVAPFSEIPDVGIQGPLWTKSSLYKTTTIFIIWTETPSIRAGRGLSVSHHLLCSDEDSEA